MGIGVDIKDLRGFRLPTEEEKEKYGKECIAKIKSELIPNLIWLIIISPVCVLMWLTLIGYVTNENLLLNGDFMVMVLAVLCISVVEYFLVSSRNSSRLRIKDLKEGSFWVLDCKVYDVNLITDTTGGEVFIETLTDQKCRYGFIVGTDLATECYKCIKNSSNGDYVPLVLVGCCFEYWVLRR